MYKCFFCDELLNEKNTSVEHIIPNSIGGRLKSKKILCKRCNSKLGEKFDSEISKMFNLTMLINNIKRDDGKTPRKEKIYIVQGENKIPISFEREKKGLSINFNQIEKRENSIFLGGSEEFVKKEKDKILKSGRNKIENEEISSYLEIKSKKEIRVDNEKLFKSLLKTGIGFYLEKGNNIEKIKDVIKILSQENNFNELKNIIEVKEMVRKTNINYHSLLLFENPITSKINCCILYFSSCFNKYFKIELSKDYQDEKFKFIFYLYNLTNSTEEMEVSKCIQSSIEEILNKELKNVEKNNSKELEEMGKIIEEEMINIIINIFMKSENKK